MLSRRIIEPPNSLYLYYNFYSVRNWPILAAVTVETAVHRPTAGHDLDKDNSFYLFVIMFRPVLSPIHTPSQYIYLWSSFAEDKIII